MDQLPAEISVRIQAIARDEVSGAASLARDGLRIVGDYAEQLPTSDTTGLLGQIRLASEAVRQARPEMAPIRVWQERLLAEMERRVAPTDDIQAAREAVRAVVAELIGRSEAAGRLAIQNAIARLAPGSVVFTASDSMTIRQAIQQAYRDGRLRRVLVAESDDQRGHRYGQLLADAVQGAGVPAEVVPDREIPSRVGEAEKIWLGADTVYADGTLLNGIGSLALSRAAGAAGKPVEVIGESAKVVSYPPPPDLTLPPEMDRVPGALIAGVVTENGVIRLPAS